ncbi:unnamed protein product [Periconia digitata]|uniref:DUF4470 domain-containing protein n=1 Tax=Periconia digitata TaxID=1303443 RepID=A0A9W4XLI0_9PLEO|nr:unnamed protein product [Periconia digitata]
MLDGGSAFVATGARRFLWGNLPALDILKLEANEGKDDQRPHHLDLDINLLFAASGDCRNAIKTIVGLPNEYAGQCTAVLNDADFAVVARNIMMLLSALHFDPAASTPIILHLWYSALLPERMLTILQKEILPYIENVCAEIQDRSSRSFHVQTFKFVTSSVRLCLRKEQWVQLISFFKVPAGLDKDVVTTTRQKVTLDDKKIDELDLDMFRWPPDRRMGNWKFRSDGVLLPFGCSREEFDTPNPTFFQDRGEWPMNHSADPLNGWLHTDYMKKSRIAEADVYGGLFFFLRDLLLDFCNRLQNTRIEFQFYSMDAADLPTYLRPEGLAFDRIEIDNICDRNYVGPATTLSKFIPLLQPKSRNPYAALIMLFLNATAEKGMERGSAYQTAETPKRRERARKFIGGGTIAFTLRDPKKLREYYILRSLGDFDELFDSYSRDVRLDAHAKENGAVMRSDHRIVGKWPYRITQDTSVEDFEIISRLSVRGWERYVEFEREAEKELVGDRPSYRREER